MSESIQVITNDGRAVTSNNGRLVYRLIAGLYVRVGQLLNRTGNLYNRPATQRYNRK